MALPPSNRKRLVSDYAIDEDAFDLVKHMDSLLETVVAVYEQMGVPLPARRYWMVGDPAEDCEQVVVSLLQVYLGIPGDQAADIQRCDQPATAVVNVYVSRSFPVGNDAKPASAEDITTASAWSATDTWVLFKAMKEFDKDDMGRPGPGVIATITGRPPRGALQSTVLNLSAMVL